MKVIYLQNKNDEVLCPPRAEESQMWIDFDGTITQKDTLDELINKYSTDKSWEIYEQQWKAGIIGSRECLEKEFSLLKISYMELKKAITSIKIDPGIYDLLKLLQSNGIPVTILSDGIDIFIQQILHNNGISNIPVRSNTVLFREPHFKFKCQYNNPTCDVNAAHCKCSSMSALGDSRKSSIYIGDGHSDLCPARKADFVFAKKALAESLMKENLPFVNFSDLSDVASFLSENWKDDRYPAKTEYAVSSAL
jgi:2-hydroxy-3-keto-5-methylthiopentenyl-1-phosphate phosphatase